MPYPTEFQAQNYDLQRDLACVNSEAWMFEQPHSWQRTRSVVARALLAFVSRLTPRIEQPAERHTHLTPS